MLETPNIKNIQHANCWWRLGPLNLHTISSTLLGEFWIASFTAIVYSDNTPQMGYIPTEHLV